jgi:hypothetical protein
MMLFGALNCALDGDNYMELFRDLFVAVIQLLDFSWRIFLVFRSAILEICDKIFIMNRYFRPEVHQPVSPAFAPFEATAQI